MHKVIFRKAIYFTELGDRENMASLRVELTLPFAPYPGLKVEFGEEFGEAVVESVIWFNNESYFYCETPAEINKMQDLSFWLESGWLLQGAKAHGVRLRT